ncbi:hypothetical protein AA206_13070 [Salmonella enterica subsp. enterica serovar Newport]|nr:hypothetical protein [Salmonella enterica subsp. enterica serovar Newport]
MRMNHMSLNRKWILFSLVLLSPAILAAENLNFNYTRAEALSADPRLSLQSRACHSLSDPLVINVQLVDGMNTQDLDMELTVKGADIHKSFARFIPTSASTASVLNVTDKDFQIPWGVAVQGELKGTLLAYTDGVPAHWKYTHPFCFRADMHSSSPGISVNTGGYIPINVGDKDDSGTDLFTFCQNKFADAPPPDDSNYFLVSKPTAYQAEQIRTQGYGFLGSRMFYFRKEWVDEVPPSGTWPNIAEQPFNRDINEKSNDATFHYILPNVIGGLAPGFNTPFTTSKVGGAISLTLSNRNISELILKIVDKSGKTALFQWSRNMADTTKQSNRLSLNTLDGDIINVSPADGFKNDPYEGSKRDSYQVNKFYTSKMNHLTFRGTLATSNDLNSNYFNFNKTTPLSIPAENRGDINLVNTDSLTIFIGQKQVINSVTGGDYYISLYGQPLKFSPVYIGKQEVITATQVRNACY